MKALIAGGEAEVSPLVAAASEAGIEAPVVVEPSGVQSSVAALAARLRELERQIAAERPDIVLAADETDTALAALLVATKLGVAVAASAGVLGSSSNGRLVGQLAGEHLPADPSGFGEWAAAHAESHPRH